MKGDHENLEKRKCSWHRLVKGEKTKWLKTAKDFCVNAFGTGSYWHQNIILNVHVGKQSSINLEVTLLYYLYSFLCI